MINHIGEQKNRGMTLIELMVVLSIFAVISSMIIFNHSDYKSSTTIKILSDDIALSIRQAQAYAIGVKSTDIHGQPSFPGYGIHFNTDDGISSLNNTSTCSDGIDNDGDGVVDSVDSSCMNSIGLYDPNLMELSKIIPPPNFTQCQDGIDNDGDGSFDIGDSSCHTDFNSSNSGSYNTSSSENSVSQCDDGIDNNSDGMTDIGDPNCHTDGDLKNNASYNSMWNDEGASSSLNWMQCINGIDDNFNGLADYQEPNCHSDGNLANPNSYNPNINDENDRNIIVFESSKLDNLFKNILNPVVKFVTRAQKVFADSSIFNIDGDSKSFVSFADIPCSPGSGIKGNLQYDYPNSSNSTPCGQVISPTDIASCDPNMISSGSECLAITNIIGSNKIAGFCINQECESYINGDSNILRSGSLDFVFTRPNPGAAFCYSAFASTNCTESVGVSHAGVVIQSTSDLKTKVVVVWVTGQISVY